jgi:NADH-quinone oxidoreductase subunit F
MDKVLHRVFNGHGSEADIELLENIAKQMKGKCLCALGEFAISPVLSTIAHFPEEYMAKVRKDELQPA